MFFNNQKIKKSMLISEMQLLTIKVRYIQSTSHTWRCYTMYTVTHFGHFPARECDSGHAVSLKCFQTLNRRIDGGVFTVLSRVDYLLVTFCYRSLARNQPPAGMSLGVRGLSCSSFSEIAHLVRAFMLMVHEWSASSVDWGVKAVCVTSQIITECLSYT